MARLASAYAASGSGLVAPGLATVTMATASTQIRATRYRFLSPYLAGSIWYDDALRWVHAEFEHDGATVEYRLDP